MTLLLVVGLLLVAFLFAAAYYGGWFDSGKPGTGSAPCRTVTPGSTVKPSQVKLNVYNASNRNGLARKVAAELKLQGFQVGDVANDPLKRAVKTTAEVRYGAKGKAGAQLVASEVAGSKLVADKRKDASVDLVLGATYKELVVTPAASSSTPTCPPTTPAAGSSSSTTTK